MVALHGVPSQGSGNQEDPFFRPVALWLVACVRHVRQVFEVSRAVQPLRCHPGAFQERAPRVSRQVQAQALDVPRVRRRLWIVAQRDLAHAAQEARQVSILPFITTRVGSRLSSIQGSMSAYGELLATSWSV